MSSIELSREVGMSRDIADVVSRYENLCERIFRDWLDGRTGGQGLAKTFSIEHCPEPYLDFAPGESPLIYVTHNPGHGEPFQLRSAVDTQSSPIKSRESYRENARRLAAWYSGAGMLAIKAAARTRIAAMGDLATQLGATGVRQVESFPLHSDGADAKRLLSEGMHLVDSLATYRSCCKNYIASGKVVIAISGGAPNRAADAVRIWADVIGLSLDQADFLPIKLKAGVVTTGVFAGASDGGLRVLFCCQGSNSLPARARMPDVVRFLKALLK